MKAMFFGLICAAMLATAQVFWKIALTHHKLSWKLIDLMHLGISAYFIGGALLYVIATVFWLYLLNKYPLSYIYPMIAFAYAIGAILAMTILKEQISLMRWSGIFLVILGVALIGMNK